MKKSLIILAAVILAITTVTASASAKVTFSASFSTRDSSRVRHPTPYNHRDYRSSCNTVQNARFYHDSKPTGWPYNHKTVIASKPVIIRTSPIIYRPVRPKVVYTTSSIYTYTPRTFSTGTTTVWITNENGSRSSVVLTRSGPGYVGPNGEYYSTLPSESQLAAVYAIRNNPEYTNEVTNDVITIMVKNADGTNTPVTLTRNGDQYIGPRNEVYSTLPTTEQLAMVYADTTPAETSTKVIVWITNSNGSQSKVELEKVASYYIGPNGERYLTMPTELELQKVYGF